VGLLPYLSDRTCKKSTDGVLLACDIIFVNLEETDDCYGEWKEAGASWGD
jgi:hypothetical protein